MMRSMLCVKENALFNNLCKISKRPKVLCVNFLLLQFIIIIIIIIIVIIIIIILT